jgi:hypothetical protein
MDQSTPAGTAELIFNAARTGDYSRLKEAIAATADEDGKMIASVEADKLLQESFKTYFAKGMVNGEPVISGNRAEVKIKFGPDGKKEETFNMILLNGKWYLESF